MEQEGKNEQLLAKVLGLDDNIRFAAISDMDGDLLASAVRPDVRTMVTLDQTKQFMQWSTAAWKLRKAHHPKLGRELYNLSVFENLRRATMMVDENRLILIAIDNKGGQKQILDKILNMILYKDPTHY